MTEALDSQLRDSLRDLRLVILDVDGVLTDGRFTLDNAGHETKTFHTQDGYGIRRLIDAGIVVAIITGRRSGAVEHRARELGISPVIQGARDKAAAIRELLTETGIQSEHALAVGDDIPDLAMFEAVATAVAVANAVPELKKRAHYVTQRSGGAGAVREIADLIVKSRTD
ncbi:MAG: HAD hydrolase family protein [Pseudomonadota bacterium]